MASWWTVHTVLERRGERREDDNYEPDARRETQDRTRWFLREQVKPDRIHSHNHCVHVNLTAYHLRSFRCCHMLHLWLPTTSLGDPTDVPQPNLLAPTQLTRHAGRARNGRARPRRLLGGRLVLGSLLPNSSPKLRRSVGIRLQHFPGQSCSCFAGRKRAGLQARGDGSRIRVQGL